MKKINLFFASLFLLSLGTKAQEKTFAVKLNYLSPLVKTVNLSFEKAVKEDASFQLGVYYTGFSSSGIKYSGLGLTPEYRKYLTGEALDGAYIAPFIRYQSLTLTESSTSSKGTISTIGGGLIVGRQWMMKGISFDLFVGPIYNSGSYSSKSGAAIDAGSFEGFTIRFGTTIGLGF
ncbi:MAG: DUF3575 domain-containing protein [Bacteroidia bacterium]|nr:DUF3575 domain-containing protein [Bacteroidia bacterium]